VNRPAVGTIEPDIAGHASAETVLEQFVDSGVNRGPRHREAAENKTVKVNPRRPPPKDHVPEDQRRQDNQDRFLAQKAERSRADRSRDSSGLSKVERQEDEHDRKEILNAARPGDQSPQGG